MAVRNFYVESKIDGRKGMLVGGPTSKTGGMWIELLQRSHGKIKEAIAIECLVKSDGETLHINVFGPDGNTIWSGDSKR